MMLFWLNPGAFWPCIDSNATTTFKAQKGSKDIVKTSGSNFILWIYENIFVRKQNKT